MDTQSQSQRGSTRYHTVDARFASILSLDTGIETSIILRTLGGVPQKQAIEIALWASEQTDNPSGALLAWARKHGRGQYRKPRRNMTAKEQRATLDRRVA